MANVQLAKNLKILRKKHNYTQQDLSDILNITRQAYSQTGSSRTGSQYSGPSLPSL